MAREVKNNKLGGDQGIITEQKQGYLVEGGGVVKPSVEAGDFPHGHTCLVQ